jgi:NADH dehydrogenase
MKIAITGGTGFVGRHLARALVECGHEIVLVARGQDTRDPGIRKLSNATFKSADVRNERQLREAFAGCEAVAHCAGINREIGNQTYAKVHVEGTQAVVNAARAAGASKILFMSFLRARPGCGSPYHESKWQAEEIVRHSGLNFTIFKAGVVYGKGDHMLDHLSLAFHTFPLFAFVGFQDQPVAPVAVEDLARLMVAALTEGRLSNETVMVLGPERMTLREAVTRVAVATGQRPVFFRLPIWAHRAMAWGLEKLMKVPLISLAQVRILREGVTEPYGEVSQAPPDLAPKRMFSQTQIVRGLPEPGRFGLSDLRCCCSSRSQS